MNSRNNSRPIDLRSDTVTRPTAAMREAMAMAEVGDDVFGEDPTVNALEVRAAEIFGKQAAVFVPSGTMGNLVCLRCHAEPGDEVILEEGSHIYNFEMGGVSAVAGLVPRVVRGRNGLLDPEKVRAAVQRPPGFRSRTVLLCLENTHNIAGGRVSSVEDTAALCEAARESGLKIHLDGARIFNAAAATGCSVQELTADIDSLSFCFSKGLGAPVGSMVVAGDEFAGRARRIRKMLGGGMRQAGVIAAAARVALEESPARLHEDHRHAQMIAEVLAEVPELQVDPASVETNIVVFEVAALGVTSFDFLERLRAEGILAVPLGERRVRMVTHRDVRREDIESVLAALRRVISALQ